MPVDLSELTEHFKVWRYFHLTFFAFYETHVKYLKSTKIGLQIDSSVITEK